MKAKKINNILIYYPEGRISNDSAEQFEYQLTQLIDYHGNCDLIINMEDVSSISSKSIEAIISIAQKMESEDRIVSICNPNDLVIKIISILNINSFIAVYKTEEENIDELSKEVVKA